MTCIRTSRTGHHYLFISIYWDVRIQLLLNCGGVVSPAFTFRLRARLIACMALLNTPPTAMCGRYLVQTQHWSLRFDPTSRGDTGPLNQRWYSQTALLANQSAQSQWVSLRGPHTRAWSEMPEMESWRANHTAGRPYSGIGWFWARIYLTSPHRPSLHSFPPLPDRSHDNP